MEELGLQNQRKESEVRMSNDELEKGYSQLQQKVLGNPIIMNPRVDNELEKTFGLTTKERRDDRGKGVQKSDNTKGYNIINH